MQFGFVPRRLMGNPADMDPSHPFDEWIKDLEIVIGTAASGIASGWRGFLPFGLVPPAGCPVHEATGTMR